MVTFNPNASIRSGNVRRKSGGGGFGGGGLGGGGMRGGGLAIGGGSGCLLLVVLLLFTLMGGNPLELLGGTSTVPQQQGTTSAQGEVLQECQTGNDANTNDDCLVQGVIESADNLWEQAAPAAGVSNFRVPNGWVFSDAVNTGCGPASSSTGPFYCPADEGIYIDTTFYADLQSRFGSDGGQLAKMYVIAHEYGHHIQYLDGTLTSADRNDTGPQGEFVRMELQADCYAGMWAHHAANTTNEDGQPLLQPLTEQDIQSALSAASAVGDDNIQENVSGGRATPESWTHGSSEQRMRWFTVGYEQGTVQACDTFSPREV